MDKIETAIVTPRQSFTWSLSHQRINIVMQFFQQTICTRDYGRYRHSCISSFFQAKVREYHADVRYDGYGTGGGPPLADHNFERMRNKAAFHVYLEAMQTTVNSEPITSPTCSFETNSSLRLVPLNSSNQLLLTKYVGHEGINGIWCLYKSLRSLAIRCKFVYAKC